MKYQFLFLALLWGLNLFAQEDLSYQKPSAPILALADYERPPTITMDEKRENMLLMYRNTYKTLDELNQDELRLGGLRINPNTNMTTTATYLNNLKIRKVKEVKAEPIQVAGLPQNPKIANITWSPDYTKIAFTHTTNSGVELWLIDVATAKASKISETNLNGAMGNAFIWYKDSKHLLVKFNPANRQPLINNYKGNPQGPTVSVSGGKVSQNRTYQDLLKNKTDEANFEILMSSQLYKVGLDGTKTLFKDKDLYVGMSFSPDGNYIMLTTLQKPFSYVVPFSRFPQIYKVFDTQNASLVKIVNEVPLNEIIPKGFSAVRVGRRNMAWRDDMPATLYFVEALDEGDPAKKVEFRDEVFSWNAPFNQAPVAIAKTQQRFAGIIWGNEKMAILEDSWYDTRNRKTYLINPSNPQEKPKLLFDRNYQDIYNNPGDFQTQKNQWNRNVLMVEKDKLFLVGEGFSPKGQFPFIDELDLRTLKTKRLYQSNFTDKKEDILSVEDIKTGLALVQIQSPTEYPNYFFRNFRKKTAPQQITFNPNPFESIKNVEKQVIKYKRADGVELSGTLYLPLGYDKNKKEKLPLLIWAYPREYKDMQTAGQNNQNANEFTFPTYGSFIYWVTKGYVVLDDAAFPIVGEGSKEPNDNFIEQLVANAKAAIDAVDNLGYIDRSKVAVGGHSYGAFMTANLLTHSDLFACGIARSGAYNRTLTPFGFQSEQRNYWDVPEVYNTMSPFMNASKMKKPILLIHGEADNNPGTFTLQTERYFQALKGLGADARMVILPRESHGYAAKESILHTLWEQEQFLDKYLKGRVN
jgi:dipeptidyl aminopeptidase/acylaminoacyl peptidase